MAAPALSARGLRVQVGERVLVDALDLDVDEGEVVALVGPSGAGKTTTLRALAALLPAEGELRLHDRPAASWGYPSYRRRVAYVAQRPIVFDGSVAENLALPFGFHAAEDCVFDDDAARRALAELRLDLDEVWGAPARQLSEGQRQRVALVRTLMLKPDVLLLDEPTSALDPDAVAAVETALRGELARGVAIVLVSHDPVQRERLGARCLAVG